MKISIVNYGLGNLRSVEKSFQRLGQNIRFANNAAEISDSDKLILPGVGHFAKGVSNLRERNLWDALNEAAMHKKKPILGICLGMQLMTSFSEEGNAEGLSWIKGKTKKFSNIEPLKTPHMGWNNLQIKAASSLIKNITNEDSFYFVHSYYVNCEDKADVLAESSYGIPFVSGFQKDNIIGVQFHPEKSHKAGLRILKNFIEL